MLGAVSTPSKGRYNLLIARLAARALSDVLPVKITHAVYEFIIGPLLDNPQRVGKPLGPPLAPAYSARRGDYRVLYFLDDATHTVKVTAIRHRADAYRS
ncbi:MAG: type II toxin-antitoxin system RelE/ParE family toxin [Actinomycetales bacterium]|nr:type II toxin-antitoxin system RelE/ParE family toxin [Actinomycetales bacterium]